MKSKKVTIYDIANHTGLSVATVSRVLNDNKNVKGETRDYVHQVMREMNYVPDVFARSLKKKSSRSIGIIVYEINSPFFSEIISSIEDYFTNKYFNIMLAAISGGMKNELELLNYFISKKIDGLMLLGSYNTDRIRSELKSLSTRIPIVLVGDNIGLDTIYTVNSDSQAGAYRAVRYLIDLGHRQIGLLTGYSGQYDSEERLLGYRQALKDVGIPMNRSFIFQGDYSVEKCQGGIVDFVKRNPSLTALFCCSDMMAIGAAGGLMQAGYQIPRDISVVGFDNIRFSAYVYPSITTVDQGITQLGYSAAALLNEAITTKQIIPQQVINKTNLIIRDSTANPRS
ncbi:MAG: LacI family DNA-binding transcriptional regulator [Candidatus Delongbacteria bacterium]|nr:LacI family DNA-binding transcriptional regulator [Candidatus Delongbacteria bacterium]